jgi:Lrp/AsnC family transcriptional regulator for asnA, asnC and gidA
MATVQPKRAAKDEIDLKIIGHLLEDARRTFAEIGKEIGISKNAVWSRYKNMTKKGIINGATVQINYKKLGCDAVGILLMDVEPSQIEQVSNYVKARLPDAFGPFLSDSRYNLRAVVPLKTINELGKIKEELRKKAGITDLDSSIWTDIWLTPENLSLIPNRAPELSNKKTTDNSIFDADEIDKHIINELANDSRTSFRVLAKQLGISVDTVARRYENLREEGVIVSRIQIDPMKIGYYALAHFYLRTTSGHDVDAVIREIFPIPDVFYIMKCRGDINIGVVLMVKSIQDMLRKGDCITRIRGVKRRETVVTAITEKWPIPRTYTSTLSRNLTIT